jgi:hypothetical protein
MLQFVEPDNVFTALKSSVFIVHDLETPFHQHIPDIAYFLTLKRWHNLNRGMEFRCFVNDGRLVAISQRDCTAYFEFLPQLK